MRRAELDELEEHLAKHLTKARAERDELAVAERVLDRMSEQLADDHASAAPTPGQMRGRAVMLRTTFLRARSSRGACAVRRRKAALVDKHHANGRLRDEAAVG
ncbi:hypothetical protein ACFU3O_15030 [Streptomyces antibioticus]|uniref:hypothetical protein n=1 Tax=Streptomyces antibioticus TaxID=1890 RepID=UPI0036C45AEA